MKQEAYIKCTDFFRKPGVPAFAIFFMSKVIPVIIANIYFIFCVICLFAGPMLLLRFVGVPFFAFLLVTALRILIHRKRPYEVMNFRPISYKKQLRSGKSFPSRHTACAGVIAVACLYLWPGLGVVMLVLAVIVALSRVLAGVHYISDVAAGLALGVIVGIIGFYVIIF